MNEEDKDDKQKTEKEAGLTKLSGKVPGKEKITELSEVVLAYWEQCARAKHQFTPSEQHLEECVLRRAVSL